MSQGAVFFLKRLSFEKWEHDVLFFGHFWIYEIEPTSTKSSMTDMKWVCKIIALILFKKEKSHATINSNPIMVTESRFQFSIWFLRPVLVENSSNGKLKATMNVF